MKRIVLSSGVARGIVEVPLLLTLLVGLALVAGSSAAMRRLK